MTSEPIRAWLLKVHGYNQGASVLVLRIRKERVVAPPFAELPRIWTRRDPGRPNEKSAAAMDLQSVPVDIIEHILLQVDSPISLIRASSTCKLWRRLITGAVFLRRIRSLHEPPAVGSYSSNNLSITSLPRYDAAPPPATIASRYLSLEFLRGKEKRKEGLCISKWTVKDSRGSLLLLVVDVVKGFHHRLEMFVCEPLTQRMVKVGTLTTTAFPPERVTEAFLLEGPEPGGTGMSNFRAVRLSRNGSVASIFTSGGSCRKVRTGNDSHGKEMRCIGSAAGSMYWHADGGRAVLAMDQSTAEFSSSSLPDIADFAQPAVSSKFAVTTGGDGKARILFLGADDELKVFARRKNGRTTGWVLERRVRTRQLSGVPATHELFLDRSVPLSAETMGTVQILASRGMMTEVTAAFNLDIHRDTMQMTRTERSTKAYPIRLQFPTSLRACTTPAPHQRRLCIH
jgi:hypothetical protein